MPRVSFTPQLERFLDAPSREVTGTTVRDTLAHVFADNPRLRGYVLDEHGAVRQHVTIFINDTTIRDRTGLTDPVEPDAEIFVLQALSGGAAPHGTDTVDCDA